MVLGETAVSKVIVSTRMDMEAPVGSSLVGSIVMFLVLVLWNRYVTQCNDIWLEFHLEHCVA